MWFWPDLNLILDFFLDYDFDYVHLLQITIINYIYLILGHFSWFQIYFFFNFKDVTSFKQIWFFIIFVKIRFFCLMLVILPDLNGS